MRKPRRVANAAAMNLLVALRWERLAVQVALRQARRVRGLPGKLWRVQSATRSLSIVETGMGLTAAATTARWLVEHHPDTPLVMLGCAGGLVPEIAALDVVVPEAVVDDAERYVCDDGWRARLSAAAAAAGVQQHAGDLVSVAEPLLTVAAKRAAAQRTGAVAVDMESAAVARIAAAAGCPFAVVRVVLDDADTEIPSTLAALATLPIAGTALTLTRLTAALLKLA